MSAYKFQLSTELTGEIKILASSRRTVSLMKEDSITLNLASKDPQKPIQRGTRCSLQYASGVVEDFVNTDPAFWNYDPSNQQYTASYKGHNPFFASARYFADINPNGVHNPNFCFTGTLPEHLQILFRTIAARIQQGDNSIALPSGVEFVAQDATDGHYYKHIYKTNTDGSLAPSTPLKILQDHSIPAASYLFKYLINTDGLAFITLPFSLLKGHTLTLLGRDGQALLNPDPILNAIHLAQYDTSTLDTSSIPFSILNNTPVNLHEPNPEPALFYNSHAKYGATISVLKDTDTFQYTTPNQIVSASNAYVASAFGHWNFSKTPTQGTTFIPVEYGKTYVCRLHPVSTSNKFCTIRRYFVSELTEDKVCATSNDFRICGSESAITTWPDKPYLFTPSKTSTKYIAFRYDFIIRNTEVAANNITDEDILSQTIQWRMQVEEGTTPTDFHPFAGWFTLPLTIDNTTQNIPIFRPETAKILLLTAKAYYQSLTLSALPDSPAFTAAIASNIATVDDNTAEDGSLTLFHAIPLVNDPNYHTTEYNKIGLFDTIHKTLYPSETSSPFTTETLLAYHIADGAPDLAIIATPAFSIKSIQYQYASILNALATLTSSENYNAEWGFKNGCEGVNEYGYLEGALFIGYIEKQWNSPIELIDGTDATFSISRSQGEYCNRLIAFGSTTNMPSRYRKTLILTASKILDNPYSTADYQIDNPDLSLDTIPALPFICYDEVRAVDPFWINENTLTGRATLTPCDQYGNKTAEPFTVYYNLTANGYVEDDPTYTPFFLPANHTLSLGDHFTISPITIDDAPLSILSDALGRDLVTTSGEIRLALPLNKAPLGYIQIDDITPAQIVEKTKIYENIYPSLTLSITAVSTEKSSTTSQDDDGNETTSYVSSFCFFIPTSTLNFSASYIPYGKTLQAAFLTGRLAGLTFDLEFIGNTPSSDPIYSDPYAIAAANAAASNSFTLQKYRIVASHDAGGEILLPNAAFAPQPGDTFKLLGYAPSAMAKLGLIDAAEAQLYQAASNDLTQLANDSITVSASLFSDTAQDFQFEYKYQELLGAIFNLVADTLPSSPLPLRCIAYDIPFDIYPDQSFKLSFGQSHSAKRFSSQPSISADATAAKLSSSSPFLITPLP